MLIQYLPHRGDVVEVDTWVSQSGKNGMRRDWLVRDCNTGETLTRASRLVFLLVYKLFSFSSCDHKIPDVDTLYL